jgi:hypothetical protein
MPARGFSSGSGLGTSWGLGDDETPAWASGATATLAPLGAGFETGLGRVWQGALAPGTWQNSSSGWIPASPLKSLPQQ